LDDEGEDVLKGGDEGEADLEEEEFSPYSAVNPYERPLSELLKTAPHLWELSNTPGCGDYRIALRDIIKDRAVHETKLLHAVLSYPFDATEALLLFVEQAQGDTRQLKRILAIHQLRSVKSKTQSRALRKIVHLVQVFCVAKK